MIENSLSSLSESMQMYIVTIARLWKDKQPVPLSRLAEVFSISPVSVNEMCRKLQDNGLVNYLPYKGATLTPEGEKKANSIIRRHRLWEVFLTEKLGVDFSNAHEIACQLEHATSDLLADRLDAFLGFPAVNPDGEPIPRSDHPVSMPQTVYLDTLFIGQEAYIYQIEAGEEVRLFLQNAGVRPGVSLNVVAVVEESMLLQLSGGKNISLSRDLTRMIKVIHAEKIHGEFLVTDQQNQEEIIRNEEVAKVSNVDNLEAQKVSVKQVPLSQLKNGQRGIVVRVGGKGQIRQRMMDMGLVPGSEVEVVRVAPLGDPIEFTVKGYNLSLRKSEAKEIYVEVNE